jgi:hypothetical protein
MAFPIMSAILMIGKTSLEFTIFLGKSGNLPVILLRTDSRKDAKIAKKRMDVTLQFARG